MLEKSDVQNVMNKKNNLENTQNLNSKKNVSRVNVNKKDKLNGYLGKFKKFRNDKRSPELQKSHQVLRTAQRKEERLIQSGNINIRNISDEQEFNKKSYLNKFLKLANKNEQESKHKVDQQDEQNQINDKMVGNNLKIQNR